jgi:hypothetical protein
VPFDSLDIIELQHIFHQPYHPAAHTDLLLIDAFFDTPLLIVLPFSSGAAPGTANLILDGKSFAQTIITRILPLGSQISDFLEKLGRKETSFETQSYKTVGGVFREVHVKVGPYKWVYFCPLVKYLIKEHRVRKRRWI